MAPAAQYEFGGLIWLLLLLLKIPLRGFTSMTSCLESCDTVPCYLVAQQTKRASPVNVRKLKFDRRRGWVFYSCCAHRVRLLRRRLCPPFSPHGFLGKGRGGWLLPISS